MAPLIPSIGSCVSRMTLGERRLTTPRAQKWSGDYQPGAEAIQVMTMKVSKGLEFPVVALPGVGNTKFAPISNI